MHKYTFQVESDGLFPNKTINQINFEKEIIAKGLSHPIITIKNGFVDIEFSYELNQTQQILLSEVIVSHQGNGVSTDEHGSLEYTKKKLIESMDSECVRRIFIGFSYSGISAFTMQPMTSIFSLSQNAQNDYLGLRQNSSLLTYPIAWPDKNDEDAILIMNSSEASALCDAAFSNVVAKKMQAANYKIGVRLATSSAEAEGIFLAYLNSPIP